MVRVNGKKFKVYDLDNLESFKNRLAVSMKTLPEYLYFPNGLTHKDIRVKKGSITVVDILAEILKSARDNSSIFYIIDSVKKRLGENYNIRDNVVELWISYNKKLDNVVKKQGKFPLDQISKKLVENRVYMTDSQFMRVWENRTYIKNNLQNDLINLQKKVNITLKLFEEYDDIDEAAVYTDMRVEYIQFILTLDITDMSLLELFNSINLDDNVPFATTKKFYKILKDFIPSDEWTESNEDVLTVKVNQKKYISSKKTSNYSDAIIKVDSDGIVTSEVTINTDKGNVSRNDFIQRSLNIFSFPEELKIKDVQESKVAGLFYYPSLRLDKYVFSELVMNNDIFSRIMYIDDHDKATKKKSGLYVHFFHPSTGYITATITEKKMIKGDLTMKDEDQDIFPVGESYIRVRISKADNMTAVENFQEMLGKLFILYDKEYNNVVDFYRQYIPDFGSVEIEEEEEKIEMNNSDIAPDIFVTNYTRNCKQDRMPSIISEEEALDAEAKGKSVMKFPRDIPEGDEKFKFPMDGEDQHYYICDNEKYKYVGLKENKLKNADIYPFVPCCFLVDQRKKPNYVYYHTGNRSERKKDKTQAIIITDKFLTHQQFGRLPPNIDSLFTLINPNHNYEEVRKGIIQLKGQKRIRNEHSFLDCVMEALYEETGILDITDPDEREAILIDTRNKLATKVMAPLCRQEMYDYTVDEIIDILKDPNQYLDPKLFVHLLEDYFECNIFIFTKNILDGTMTLPRHTQAYYKNINRGRCIYIYEHMGSESDHAQYPQCELIVRYNTKTGEPYYSFTYEESVNIRRIFSRLRRSYSLDKSIKECYFHIPESVKILSQWIDSYGKTRIINVNFNGNKVSLITSPLQPIRTNEAYSSDIYYLGLDDALELASILKMTIESQTIVGGYSKEINGIVGNVSTSIPIVASQPLGEINENLNGLSYTEEQQSSLTIYNKNKKLARYIIEYVIWVYSHYLQDNGIENITDESISFFSKNYFKIIPDYEYGYISKTFTQNSSIMSNDKIIVQTEEMNKRLLYVLRLQCQRNTNKVLQYYKNKVIQNYYEDVTDFRQNKNQIILFGQESVEKWISENNIKYVLHNEIKIGTSVPYFFKNKLVDSKVYLAQNTTSLGKASDIAITWFRKDYNIGIYSKEKTPVSFTLYSYINGGQINPVKIRGKEFSHNVKILGYKIDNNPFYTVLLPLS